MSNITRTTISIDSAVAAAAEKVADAERRNFSNLCEVALEEYCGTRKAVAPSEELAECAKHVGGESEAVKILRRAIRRKETAA